MAVVGRPERSKEPVTGMLSTLHFSGKFCDGKGHSKAGVVLPSGVPGDLHLRHHHISGRTFSESHPSYHSILGNVLNKGMETEERAQQGQMLPLP